MTTPDGKRSFYSITIQQLKSMSFDQLKELMLDIREEKQLIAILQATESALMFLENCIPVSNENEYKQADDMQRYRDYKNNERERPY